VRASPRLTRFAQTTTVCRASCSSTPR
jgi:hypothetical protein